MIEMIQPITDRTKNDVNRVIELSNRGWANLTSDEKQEWINGLKGSLNKSDLERIENNVQLLSDVLELDLETYFGRIPEFPHDVYLERLLYNINKIRNAYAHYDDTPFVPSELNVYTDLNDIERILEDVYKILQSNFYNYCGELYAGEVVGLPL